MPVTQTPDVENKTPAQQGQADKKEFIADSGGTNVLNDYRLSTYVFTLSAVNKDNINSPDLWRQSEQNLIILKSGGKGAQGISATTGMAQSTQDKLAEYDKKVKTNTVTTSTPSPNDILANTQNNLDAIGGFNANSPGRFDMFLDKVEIETYMGFSEAGGTTQPTTINFEVFEPYSINGFIEALHLSAVAAGYPTYTDTPFLLKIDMLGYPDSSDMSAPELVPKSTRYFPIILANLEVVLNETGTRYQVKAIASNEAGYGIASQLKKSIKMTGGTVKEILNNLMVGMTKQVREADEAAKKPSKIHDEYKIIFPDWVEGKGWDKSKENKIAKEKVTELLKDNTLYKFPDPGGSAKPTPTPDQNAKQLESFKYEPTGGAVQFPEGKTLNECIQAIIRDSKYVRNIVEKLASPEWQTVVDPNGMVDYFLIKLEITNVGDVDPDLKRPHQVFTYVVTPHKILYTRIPNYGNQQVDMTKLAKLSLRGYNYIYTGKNVDIINFKLNFNTLFFEAIPSALGKDSAAPSRDAAGRNNSTVPQTQSDDLKRDTERRLPATPRHVDPALTGIGARDNAVKQDSAYYALAKGMHQAIVDSKGSMLTGEMEIFGDPLYLVTGGIAGYNPPPSPRSNRLTIDDEANLTLGEVLITINFRNPIDIDPLEAGGRVRFDSELIPFSGIYRVIKVRSKFKEGIFTQVLEIIRIQGQPFPTENPSNAGIAAPSIPTNRMVTAGRPNDTIAQNSTPAVADPGNRASTFNLLSQQARGLPSPGLPGQLSNFTAATGGLGGTTGVLNQISGANPNLAGATRLANQAFGGSIPQNTSLFANGIPMNAQSAMELQQRVLSPAALIQQISTNLLNGSGLTGAAPQLANQFISQASAKINSISIPGSGIGVGATFKYVTGVTDPTSSYDIISNPLPTAPTAIPVSGPATSLDSNSLSAVANINRPAVTSFNVSDIQQKARAEAEAKALAEGKSPIEADSIGNAAGNLAGADALANLNLSSGSGSTIPPAPGMSGVAGQTGINASQLSGLSPNLTSKLVDQIATLANNAPADTNLSQASAQGVQLNNLDKDSMKHLPATNPYNVAPLPAAPDLFLGHLAKVGGANAVARAFGVNDIFQVSKNQLPASDEKIILGQAPTLSQKNQQLNALQSNSVDDVASITKYLTSNVVLGNISGLLGTREGQMLQLQNRFPGSPINLVANVGGSVASKFGSKSSGQSPLDKLMIR